MILAIGDGNTYYHLEGGTSPYTFVSRHFTPARPALTPSEIKARFQDGGELYSVVRENLHETVSVTLVGTESQIRAFVANVEKALALAAEHATKRRGSCWYVYYDPTASSVSNAYRSQILYGSVQIERDGLSSGIVTLELQYTRRFYWEGALTELSLANGHGTTSGGRTIYNDDDATYDDWVTISGTQICGVLPAPIRLQYANESTSNVYYIRTSVAVWGGQRQASARKAFTDAAYYSSTWGGDNETRIAYWTLSTTDLDNYAGRFYRVLLYTTSEPVGVWARLRVMIPTAPPITTVYEGDLVQLENLNHNDLGVVQLPPWLPGETGLQPLSLALYVRRPGGGTLNGDYLKVVPADSYRFLIPAGYGSAAGTRVVDDQIEGLLWNEDLAGTNRTGHYYARGGIQYLWPGRDTTIYVKVVTNTGGVQDNIKGALRVHYRPRRLSV